MPAIYEMKLHEEKAIARYVWATRVPGGWIYTEYNESGDFHTNVFVPWNNEFQQESEGAVG